MFITCGRGTSIEKMISIRKYIIPITKIKTDRSLEPRKFQIFRASSFLSTVLNIAHGRLENKALSKIYMIRVRFWKGYSAYINLQPLKNGAIRFSYSSIYDRSMNIAREAKTMRMKFLRDFAIKEFYISLKERFF